MNRVVHPATRLDAIRRDSSEIRNHLIDEYAAGSIGRREFIRRGAVLGLSLPTLAFLAAACSGPESPPPSPSPPRTRDVRPSGRVRTALAPPRGALDPITVADEGGLAVLGQTGEYLAWSNADLVLEPRIAQAWESNGDGSVWTFRIRRGVRFHDGSQLRSVDVAATLDRLADVDNGSYALSVLSGVLSTGNTRVIDETTVECTLDAPHGNFPYLVSSDNFNAIILPERFDGGWESSFVGAGPWKLERYNAGVGVTLARNPDYWDPARQPRSEFSDLRFMASEGARVAALLAGDVDVIAHFSVSGGGTLLTDPAVRTLALRSSSHRQIHMRTDREPFGDPRVRQALALALDREAIVDRLFMGRADVGNDSPLAPAYPSTDEGVPQRTADLGRARQLVADAGAEGTEIPLETWRGFELPELATIVRDAAQAIGLRVRPNVTDQATYFGDAVVGRSQWLDSTLGITDYGHRGVPNQALAAPLTTDGPWNAARFSNAAYDRLVARYLAEPDLGSQREIAGRVQSLLLEETPVIVPYFPSFLTAVSSSIGGVAPTATGHVDLTMAGPLA